MNRQTYDMLRRLERAGLSPDEALQVRRCAMTLHRWFEEECGNSNDYHSWSIERDGDEPDSTPYRVTHIHQGNYGWSVWCLDDDGVTMVRATRKTFTTKETALDYAAGVAIGRKAELRQVLSRRERIADRETGARKRVAAIIAKHPGLSVYFQTDPRGAPVYILRPGDVREGADPSTCYSNGIAVHA